MPHKDAEKQREYMRMYVLNRYRERRAKALAKLGGICAAAMYSMP